MKEEPEGRPQETAVAMVFLYSALLVSALRSVFMEQFIATQASYPVLNTLFSVLFLAITLFLIIMIGKGQMWARTIFLIWFMVSLPVFGLEVYHLADKPMTGSLGILNTLFNLAALVLLFRKDSSDWFRAAKASGT